MAGKFVRFVNCPSCGRFQAFPKSGSLPLGWFDAGRDLSKFSLLNLTEAQGAFGRGIKVKGRGFATVSTATLVEAWADPGDKKHVQALYNQAKGLVAYLEGIGVR